MLVDRFLDTEERAAFAGRRKAAIATAEWYGLKPHTAAVVGGAALALHGIDPDVHVETVQAVFDLDVLLLLNAIQSRLPKYQKEVELKPVTSRVPEQTVPISVVGHDSRRRMRPYMTTVDGIGVLTVAEAASRKADSHRLKDAAGLVKAQVVAADASHSIVSDTDWSQSVAVSMAKLRVLHDDFPEHLQPVDWLEELVASEFDHSAFDGLRAAYDAQLVEQANSRLI